MVHINIYIFIYCICIIPGSMNKPGFATTPVLAPAKENSFAKTQKLMHYVRKDF